ncbi:MAG: hypothetical protein FWE69_04850 [Clostridiales bacterium]|nr:hypothetical protein [Clostridiales bacterium]
MYLLVRVDLVRILACKRLTTEIVISDCGAALNYKRPTDKPQNHYFSCHNNRQNNGLCATTHHIRVDSVTDIVTHQIRSILYFASYFEDEFVKLVVDEHYRRVQVQQRQNGKDDDRRQPGMSFMDAAQHLLGRPALQPPVFSCAAKPPPKKTYVCLPLRPTTLEYLPYAPSCGKNSANKRPRSGLSFRSGAFVALFSR